MSLRKAAQTALIVLCGASSAFAAAGSATIDVDVNKPGVAIPPTFYGLMTEEINHSYDGGLYAELIQNRSFQDPAGRRGGERQTPIHWFLVQEGGSAKVTTDKNDPVTPELPI